MTGPADMPPDPFGEHDELTIGRTVIAALAQAVATGGLIPMYEALDALSCHDAEWAVAYAALDRAGVARRAEGDLDTVDAVMGPRGRRSEGERVLAELSREILRGGWEGLHAAVLDLDLVEIRAVLRDPIEAYWLAHLRDDRREEQ